MLHFYDDPEQKEPVVPKVGDYLRYEISHSLIEFVRPNSKPIWWNNDDNKHLLGRVLGRDALEAIGETIGAMYGLCAALDDDTLAQNPNMRDRFWCVRFF